MSDTSTKRAEEIAYNLQLSGVSGSTWRATEVDASNMLRALAAERDALRAALKTARRDAREEAALVIANKTVPETPVSFEDVLERDLEMMAAIRALGGKE